MLTYFVSLKKALKNAQTKSPNVDVKRLASREQEKQLPFVAYKITVDNAYTIRVFALSLFFYITFCR